MISRGPPDKEPLSDRPLGWDTGHGRCITNLLDFYIFRPRPCFPSSLSHADHYCSPINCSSSSFWQDLALRKPYLIYPFAFVPIFQSIFRISRNSRELSWKRKEAKEFPWKSFAISSSIWYNNGIIILFLIEKFNRWIYNNKYMYIGSWLVSKIFLNKYEETLTYVFLRDKNAN